MDISGIFSRGGSQTKIETLEALSSIHDFRLLIVYSRESHWQAYIHGAKIKVGAEALALVGNGKNPEQACADYCRKIRGKTLIVQGAKKTDEVSIPSSL